MGKVQQVLEMPNELHEKLRERAQKAGLSLQDYVLGELGKVAERPANDEVWEHIRNLPAVDVGMSSADIVRQGRDERARYLDQAATNQRLSREQVIEGLRALSSVRPDLSSADILRDARDERERELP